MFDKVLSVGKKVIGNVAGVFSGGDKKTQKTNNDNQVPSQFQMAYKKGFEDGKRQMNVMA